MTSKKKSIGEQIIEGLEDALAYQRGELRGARVTRVSLTARAARVQPAPPYSGARIATLRARLRLSQPVFAKALNVSVETVRSWEQEKRCPDGAALRLLQVAERHPKVILENVRSRRLRAADQP
jgi:putative transcriptional regulator